MKKASVFGPQLTKIQLQERAKRRRNAEKMLGVKCAKGTVPQVYNHPKATIQEKAKDTIRETWFDRLRVRIKALWQRWQKAFSASRS